MSSSPSSSSTCAATGSRLVERRRQRLALPAGRRGERRVLVLDQEHGRLGVVELEPQLRRGQPPVERDEHEARLRAGEEDDHVLGRVAGQRRDAVAAREARARAAPRRGRPTAARAPRTSPRGRGSRSRRGPASAAPSREASGRACAGSRDELLDERGELARPLPRQEMPDAFEQLEPRAVGSRPRGAPRCGRRRRCPPSRGRRASARRSRRAARLRRALRLRRRARTSPRGSGGCACAVRDDLVHERGRRVRREGVDDEAALRRLGSSCGALPISATVCSGIGNAVAPPGVVEQSTSVRTRSGCAARAPARPSRRG